MWVIGYRLIIKLVKTSALRPSLAIHFSGRKGTSRSVPARGLSCFVGDGPSDGKICERCWGPSGHEQEIVDEFY